MSFAPLYRDQEEWETILAVFVASLPFDCILEWSWAFWARSKASSKKSHVKDDSQVKTNVVVLQLVILLQWFPCINQILKSRWDTHLFLNLFLKSFYPLPIPDPHSNSFPSQCSDKNLDLGSFRRIWWLIFKIRPFNYSQLVCTLHLRSIHAENQGPHHTHLSPPMVIHLLQPQNSHRKSLQLEARHH